MEADLPTQEAEIVDIELERASQFLDQLRDDPFITIIIKAGGHVRVYARSDISGEHLRQIQEALTELIKEKEHG